MSPHKPRQIHLIRHGTSSANIAHILAGRIPGVKLTTEGSREALAVGNYLAQKSTLPISHIFHSPLERTKQTATQISKALSEKSSRDPQIIRAPFLIEMDYGDWSGRKISQLALKPLWKKIQSQPSAVRFPNGESFLEAQARLIDGIFNEVLTPLKPGYSAVIVSHGDPIKVILNHFLGASLDAFQKISINPASLSTLTFSGEHAMVSAMNIQVDQLISTSSATVGGELNKKKGKA